MNWPLPEFTKDEWEKILANTQDLTKLDIPRPSEVYLNDFEDHAGEDSLKLTLVFGEDIPVERSMWSNIHPFTEELRQFIRGKDPMDRFVYVDIVRVADKSALAG